MYQDEAINIHAAVPAVLLLLLILLLQWIATVCQVFP